MSDEDALLAAIAAHPDEDTPRLAYADWLDEHGRHTRAEFVRVQIDVAAKETLPRVLQNRHVDVWKRNQELIDHHWDDILGPPADVLRTAARVEFRRGFVSEVTVSLREFAHPDTGRALAALTPLPRVVASASVDSVRRFLGFDPSQWFPESRPDWPRHVVSAVRTEPAGDTDGDDEWGTYTPDLQPFTWPRLDELDISGCRLGNENVAVLLQRGGFPALVDLDLSGNDLTDAAVWPLLFGSGLARQLTRLILGGNPITDFGARLLAEQWPAGADDRLKELNLRFAAIGQPGHQALTARFGGRVVLF
jgi:uncharacterized protein (TIGR02996 family)